MKKLIILISFIALVGGCVAEPAVVTPTAIVKPTYAVPGPGYSWRYHPHYGWGWYHPRLGWHLGWR